MAILIRLAATAVAGAFTYLTQKVPWLAILGVVATVAGLVLTILQIIKELKALGWIS